MNHEIILLNDRCQTRADIAPGPINTKRKGPGLRVRRLWMRLPDAGAGGTVCKGPKGRRR